ncbi:hypothetical protein [uncultured Methanomethylovorans sp.]|uniref:hypothetical protein n=1 Tax=uncultured Methanomethylovorans sp. TaxID=183759 RepID=UPI002AA7D2FB|nr:hypothetical protein [uncultured Methanomethylovorans sp.]
MNTSFLIALDVLMRGLMVVLALLVCYELNNYSADVVRSRLFISYNKLKLSFYFLSLSLLFFFFEPLLSTFPASVETSYRYSFAMFFFQVSLVFLLHNIYIALKPPHKIL